VAGAEELPKGCMVIVEADIEAVDARKSEKKKGKQYALFYVEFFLRPSAYRAQLI